MNITILGCGPSGGVPLIGCECAICTSEDPRNKRSRTSILIETEGKRLLVDTSPDLRQQALTSGFKTIDAVLYTHAHADHTHGIDELRSFNYHMDRPIPVYGDKPTLDELRQRFDYVFLEPPIGRDWFRACLIPHTIEPYKPFKVEGIEVIPFTQDHGFVHSLGFRLGDMAYSTDVKSLPEASFDVLKDVKLWIVDCLAKDEKPTHAHLDLTLEWIDRVRPERAILTHMGHELGYEELKARLPIGIEPGYDGMTIVI